MYSNYLTVGPSIALRIRESQLVTGQNLVGGFKYFFYVHPYLGK